MVLGTDTSEAPVSWDNGSRHFHRLSLSLTWMLWEVCSVSTHFGWCLFLSSADLFHTLIIQTLKHTVRCIEAIRYCQENLHIHFKSCFLYWNSQQEIYIVQYCVSPQLGQNQRMPCVGQPQEQQYVSRKWTVHFLHGCRLH
jgi:hypothetical protein